MLRCLARRFLHTALALCALSMGGCSWMEKQALQAREEIPGVRLEQLKVPAGYKVDVLVRDVPNARQMALADARTMFVSSNDGIVYRVDLSGSQPSRKVLDGFGGSGIAFSGGSLFVGDRARVLRYDDMLRAGPDAKGVEILKGLPEQKRHGARTLAIGPDGKLYVAVGSPCDTCEEKGDEHGTLLRINRDGSGREVVARGIRNTVGFDWHPTTGQLWFTDNGPDGLGPDKPDDELNRVTRAGEHFGFPYCHNGSVPDPKLAAGRACSEFTAPALGLGPHTAALGLRFLKGDAAGAGRPNALVARHGSHPPERIGYDVVGLRIDGDRVSTEPFLTGFLQGRTYWGRPVDVITLPDGTILVSDDLNGVIYRVSRA